MVAYSLGYIFNFSTARFEQAGGIFIKSRTPRMSVFLDGALVRETGLLTGSTFLTDILPGDHLIRLEKLGFRSWSKTIGVARAAVTELRNIILVPYPLAAATSSREEIAGAQATSTPAEVLTLNKKGAVIAGRGKNAEVILENVHSFSSVSDAIFFVDKNGFLARYDFATGAITTIGRPGFFLDTLPLRFVVGQRYIAIIDSSGGLFLLDKTASTLTPVASGVKDAAFDGTQAKMLLQKNKSIALLWLADNTRHPFQKKGTAEEIVSLKIPIRDARWFYKTDAHIAYRTRDGISLAEIDQRGGSDIAELVSGATDELLTFPALPDAIFWRIGKTIFKIEL